MGELSDIYKIAQACGKSKRSGKGVSFCCPCHEDKEPSCSAMYGDHAILVRCFAGCDTRDVVDALRAMGFTLSVREGEARAKRDLSQVIKAKRAVIDHDNHVRTMLARALWHDARQATVSPVADYLTSRGLDLSAVPDVDRTIRYHPNCPRGKSRQPAMICAMRDFATDEIVAVHRTFLTPELRKDGKPMMLGPCHESAVKLTSHALTFDRRRHFTKELCVCEGVETGIGALMLRLRPCWALGSAGAIEHMQPLLSVGLLCVLADHDPAGIKAGGHAVHNWRMMGWRAEMMMPRVPGDDYADEAAQEMAQQRIMRELSHVTG